MKKAIKNETIKKRKAQKKFLLKITLSRVLFISTLGIVVSKILGIVYVIPFHAIVKKNKVVLFTAITYTIYSLF